MEILVAHWSFVKLQTDPGHKLELLVTVQEIAAMVHLVYIPGWMDIWIGLKII